VAAVAERIPGIRSRVGLPVGVGFGIKDAAGAVAIARVADAVVIGSRVIQAMESAGRASAIEAAAAFVSDIRKALDATPDSWAATSRGRPT
jgi:tryptophan synthase alpha chain